MQDHAALARHFGRVEQRGQQDVAQNIEGERHVLAHDLRVIGSGVDASGGVDVAADRFDLLGDVAGAAPRRAFEGHVLEEMRDAVLIASLAPAAGTDPDAERHGLDLGHGMADDGQARWPILTAECSRARLRCGRRGAAMADDEVGHGGEIVRQDATALVLAEAEPQTLGLLGYVAGRALDGIREFGRMRGRQDDHGR